MKTEAKSVQKTARTVGLSSAVQYLKGVGPRRAEQLARLGIETVGDLLEHYPRRHEDRSAIKPISMAGFAQLETFSGKVVSVSERRVRRNLSILKVAISDNTGTLNAVWFNQPYLKRRFKPGTELIISGRAERKFGVLEVQSPEYEELSPDDDHSTHTARIVPIYGLTEGLAQKPLRSAVKLAVDEFAAEMPEFLEKAIMVRQSLQPYAEAVRNIHFPDTLESLKAARTRLAFDELFGLQISLAMRHRALGGEPKGYRHRPDGPLFKRFIENLPFDLTSAQKRVLGEIRGDMESEKPMARLLQGDVGSGKTVVAAAALQKAVESGHQGAMMAPTEILAEQHYNSLSSLFSGTGTRVAMVSAGLAKRQRDLVLSALWAGEIDVVVGTHALIQEGVEFSSLGLVVIDEQHRFGVRQRAMLTEKGHNPDTLVMTATPIPRTLALTLYGDLDYSVIDELPPGRQQIVTQWIPEQKKRQAYIFLREQVEAGRQAYVVCPLVEESENLQAEAATDLAGRLRRQVLRGISVGLLHGRMPASEKDSIMSSFRRGEIKVLVATTVIEVGVDVPNSTVMIIEGAERFGLAQLHQLRGRVGRGSHRSFCFLVIKSASEDARRRMEVMEATTDGFKIAEADLEIRGPGEFFGTRQHGMPDLKIANPLKDYPLLLKAREEAFALIKEDPTLEHHTRIRERFERMFGGGLETFVPS